MGPPDTVVRVYTGGCVVWWLPVVDESWPTCTYRLRRGSVSVELTQTCLLTTRKVLTLCTCRTQKFRSHVELVYAFRWRNGYYV